MKVNQQRKSSTAIVRGFTLIEILIVIAIIALLATIVLVGVGTFRARGRDARRISDLGQIQNGLELYYAKKNTYPADIKAATLGVLNVPVDPGSGAYLYCTSAAGAQYVLAATLEQDSPVLSQLKVDPTATICKPGSDPAAVPPVVGVACSIAGTKSMIYCVTTQ